MSGKRDEVHTAMDWLERHLDQLFRTSKAGDLEMPDGKKVSVMLLGRYHKDKPASLDVWQRAFRNQLDISFSTAHASKGLDADYVMLLNVTEGLVGFPSQIVDDPVLQLAMPEPDDFPFSEERRLFYVALTRARRQTRIYTLQDKPSRFLVELVEDGYTEIKADKGTIKVCPKCEVGTLSLKSGDFGPFEACGAYPECDYTKKLAALGGNETASTLSVRLKNPISEGAKCPTCKFGTMVVRIGQNNQSFLGCSSFPRCRTSGPISLTQNNLRKPSILPRLN